MTLKIVGAGMAGLLAARMLHHRSPTVYERAPSLPNNHSAVLRFRTPAVGEILGIRFKKVEVIKIVDRWRNPVADALAYSHKTNGTYRSDRSLPIGIERKERWVAPPDLIERMARGVKIEYDTDFDFPSEQTKVISTIPMPTLLAALRHPGPQPIFKGTEGCVIVAEVEDCDAYASVYFPDPSVPYYRASITGSTMMIEMVGDPWDVDPHVAGIFARRCAMKFGLDERKVEAVEVKRQAYAKIVPIDDHVRRSLIYWASTLQRKAFSLGRFATWRPGLLMDDLPKDIRLIDSWIDDGGYAMDLHQGRA